MSQSQSQLQQNKYLEIKVQTASPEQLLIILIDGAIKFCTQGVEALKQADYDQAHNYLLKVQDIISELTITLDTKAEISGPLLRLYEYFVHRLIEANTRRKAEPAEEVLRYLIDLKETWMQAALSLKMQAAGGLPAASKTSASAASTGSGSAASPSPAVPAKPATAPSAAQSAAAPQAPVAKSAGAQARPAPVAQGPVNAQLNKYAQQYRNAQLNKANPAPNGGASAGTQYG